MRHASRASFILHLSAFILILSACAPTPTSAPGPTVTREANATSDAGTSIVATAPVSGIPVAAEDLSGVTIMVWHPWFGTEASLIENQIAEFNSSNEWGITILSVSQSNYAELFDNVSSSLAAPDKPQLAIGLPEHALAWDLQQGGVVDWNRYVNDPTWGWSALEIADFSPVFWTQDEVDGRRLALPAQRTARFLFYNQGWARELGFDSPPAAPDDFRAQACAANKAMLANDTPKDDGRGGWLVDIDPMTPLSWLLAFGGGAADGDGYRFLRPENIEAFRFVKTMYDDRCAWREAGVDASEMFATRQALFVAGGLEDLSAQSRALGVAANNDEWILLSFPGEERDAFVVYGSSFIMLPATDEQQLAAWLFVKSILSPEAQVRWVETTGMFPLRASTMTLAASYAATHPQWVTAVKLSPQADLPPRLASWRLVRAALGDGFSFMFRQDMDVGQVPIILSDLDRIVSDLSQ
jgi:ABC-type glycerol-3-phosphate transport system substrate-binding protein